MKLELQDDHAAQRQQHAGDGGPRDSLAQEQHAEWQREHRGGGEDRTDPTATPAYLRLATNRTGLAAVTRLSMPIVTSGPRPALRIAPTAPHVHGVSHSRTEASGKRIAWAVDRR